MVRHSLCLSTQEQRETWDEIHQTLDNNKLEPWMEKKLMRVDGTPLRVFGCAVVDLMLGGIHSISKQVYCVVSPLTTLAILGAAFLKKYKPI